VYTRWPKRVALIKFEKGGFNNERTRPKGPQGRAWHCCGHWWSLRRIYFTHKLEKETQVPLDCWSGVGVNVNRLVVGSWYLVVGSGQFGSIYAVVIFVVAVLVSTAHDMSQIPSSNKLAVASVVVHGSIWDQFDRYEVSLSFELLECPWTAYSTIQCQPQEKRKPQRNQFNFNWTQFWNYDSCPHFACCPPPKSPYHWTAARTKLNN